MALAMEGDIKECIERCWSCRDACQKMLFRHCLDQGGEHVASEHVRLMADCIQICQTAADFMVRSSKLHEWICAACAEVCDACADSCEAIDDEMMHEHAKICRECADICHRIGVPYQRRAD